MNKSNLSNVFLSLGSNIDDRMAHLSATQEKLANHSEITLSEQSKIYETEPWPFLRIKNSGLRIKGKD